MLPNRVLLSMPLLPCGIQAPFGFAFRPVPCSGLKSWLKLSGWMKRKSFAVGAATASSESSAGYACSSRFYDRVSSSILQYPHNTIPAGSPFPRKANRRFPATIAARPRNSVPNSGFRIHANLIFAKLPPRNRRLAHALWGETQRRWHFPNECRFIDTSSDLQPRHRKHTIFPPSNSRDSRKSGFGSVRPRRIHSNNRADNEFQGHSR